MKPVISVLNDEELMEIDRATRELLQDTGIAVEDQEALEIYRQAGAEIDLVDNRVRLPQHVIEEALKRCSPSVRLHGRDGIAPLRIGGPKSYFGVVGDVSNVLDLKESKFRRFMTKDFLDIMRLGDYLENCSFFFNPGTPADIPLEFDDLYAFKIMSLNTRKHLVVKVEDKHKLEKMMTMAELIVGGRETLIKKPFFSVQICLTSPLVLRQDAAETIIAVAKKGIPLLIESGPMSGGTSPATLAATIVLANAEILNAIVLAKLANPAVPIIYASWARILDMKTLNISTGGPEFGLLRIGTSQMAKFYGLPSGGGAILADSKLVDIQMGIEKLATSLLPALAGTNMITGMGCMASMNAHSLEAFVIDNEIADYVKRVSEGILVNEETVGQSVFSEVGPRGNFVAHDHTLQHFRKEMWSPVIMDRSNMEQDKDPGKDSMLKQVGKELKEALNAFTPPRLPDDIEAMLDEIIHR